MPIKQGRTMTEQDHQIAHVVGMATRKAGPSIFNARKRMGVGKVHKWDRVTANG